MKICTIKKFWSCLNYPNNAAQWLSTRVLWHFGHARENFMCVLTNFEQCVKFILAASEKKAITRLSIRGNTELNGQKQRDVEWTATCWEWDMSGVNTASEQKSIYWNKGELCLQRPERKSQINTLFYLTEAQCWNTTSMSCYVVEVIVL